MKKFVMEMVCPSGPCFLFLDKLGFVEGAGDGAGVAEAVVPDGGAAVVVEAAVLPDNGAAVVVEAAVVPDDGAAVVVEAAVIPDNGAAVVDKAAVVTDDGAAVVAEDDVDAVVLWAASDGIFEKDEALGGLAEVEPVVDVLAVVNAEEGAILGVVEAEGKDCALR